MEDTNRRMSSSAVNQRSYFRCIHAYRWKLDQMHGSGSCGDIFLPLKAINEHWHKVLEVETKRPTIVPMKFVELITTDSRNIRPNVERRATVAFTDVSIQGDKNQAGESNYIEVIPPNSPDVRQFLSGGVASRRRPVAHYLRSFTVDEVHTKDVASRENLQGIQSAMVASSGNDGILEADLAADSVGNDYENLPKRSLERSHAPVTSRKSMPAFHPRLSRHLSTDVPDYTPSSRPPIPDRTPSILARTQRTSNLGNEVPSDRSRLAERLRGFFAKRTPAEVLRQRGILKYEPIFGAFSIQQICERERSSVASLVDFCVHYIESRSGWLEEGLYRVSGNLSVIQNLRLQINCLPLSAESINKSKSASAVSRSPKLSDSQKPSVSRPQDAPPNGFEQFSAVVERLQCTLHDVSGTLKLFFRELQLPLFDADESTLTELMEQATKFAGANSQESTAGERQRPCINDEALRKLKLTMQNAYVSQLGTMMRLFLHLEKVAQHEHINRMSAQNLAVVFTPSLFPCSIAFTPSLTFVTAALIENATFIFHD